MEWYTREEVKPSEEFGEFPNKRSPEKLLEKGFVVVDKPFGPTSNQVSGWIRDELNLKRAGHFGTLDPNATGVLPVGLNKGTRIQRVLSNSKKEYVFEASFENRVDEEKLRETLSEFKGINKQLPPKKSAVKREERERVLYETEIIDYAGDRILARIKCQAGFYVRVLVTQLGEKMDEKAEMEELRRTKQGFIEEEKADTIQEIVDAYHFYNEGQKEKLEQVLHPIEDALKQTKKIVLKNSAVNAVANGANLHGEGIGKLQDGIREGDLIALMTAKGELVALAEAKKTSEEIYDTKGLVAKLSSVHMEPEKYPKRWKQD